jgi:hypothetical protein
MEDYLKYWRVVRYFIKAKYGLTTADLDMLLFLSSEGYFGKDDFAKFNELLTWDKGRFKRLRDEGWIEPFREDGKRKALYQNSYKTVRMISSIYNKLEGREIPESPSSNPIFRKNVPYTHKVYRNFIKEMNKFIRQQPRPSQK